MKNPELLADPPCLQEEERIMALLMVQAPRLLVYSALQWRVRQGLKEKGQSYPDQKRNPTQRPTARWVFQSFDGTCVLRVGQQRAVLNMKERHRTVVSVLGPNYERLYVSHPRGCGRWAIRRCYIGQSPVFVRCPTPTNEPVIFGLGPLLCPGQRFSGFAGATVEASRGRHWSSLVEPFL